jgi:hypothetical protein
LDWLKPRDTNFGIFGKNENEEKTEYSEGLKFLKQKVEPPAASGLKEAGIANSDLEGTVVGRYVRKQLAWAEAQGNWDAVRDEAEGEFSLALGTHICSTLANARVRGPCPSRRSAERCSHAREEATKPQGGLEYVFIEPSTNKK